MVRSKHRYITIKVIPIKKNRNISEIIVKNADLYQAVLSKVKKLHGDYGIASVKTGIVCKRETLNSIITLLDNLQAIFVLPCQGKYCNEMTGVAILKMRRDSHQFVSTVLPLISEIGSEHVQLHTLRTTGTLQQAYKHLKIYQQKEFESIWNSLDNDTKEHMRQRFENLEELKKFVQAEKQILMKKM